MQKQGSLLLKVASILILIWGVIAVIVNFAQLMNAGGVLSVLGGSILFGLILLLLSTVVMTVAGVMGIVNGKKPEKGGLCMKIGITALAMLLLGTILLLSGIGFEAINWSFTIIGAGLTSMYIAGARQLMNTPAEQPVNVYGYDPSGYNPHDPYNNPNNPYGIQSSSTQSRPYDAPKNPYTNPAYGDPNANDQGFGNNQNDQQ